MFDDKNNYFMINITDLDGNPQAFREKIRCKVYPLAAVDEEFHIYFKANSQPENGVNDTTLWEILLNPDHPHRANLVIEKKRNIKSIEKAGSSRPKVMTSKNTGSDDNSSWLNTLLFRKDEKLKKSLRVYDHNDNSFLVEVLGDVITTRESIYKKFLMQYPTTNPADLRLYFRNADVGLNSVDDLTLDEICINPDHPDRSNLVCGTRSDASPQNRNQSVVQGMSKLSLGKKFITTVLNNLPRMKNI